MDYINTFAIGVVAYMAIMLLAGFNKKFVAQHRKHSPMNRALAESLCMINWGAGAVAIYHCFIIW